MSILNVLTSVSSPPADIEILGVRYAGYEIIHMTSYFLIPFLLGIFFSKNKSYYLNVFLLIWIWLIISYYYNLVITIDLLEKRNYFGTGIFIPISEFRSGSLALFLLYGLFGLCSFLMGLLMKYVLRKYETHQLRIIKTLTVLAIVIIIFDREVAKVIDESIQIYKNFNLEPKISNPSQQNFGIIPGLNYRVIEYQKMILLTSLHLTLLGVISSIYIKMKNRKKLNVKN